MISIPELYAACMIEYVRSLDNGIFTGPEYLLVKETRDCFDLYYNEDVFRSACEILENEEIIQRYSHPGMMAYYRMESGQFESRFRWVAGSSTVRHYRLLRDFGDETEYKILESFHDLGSDWLRDALSTYDREIASQLEALGVNEDGLGEIPASDRVVSRRDNAAIFEEIEQSLEAIQAEVLNSNEVGDALGDLKDVALAELDGLSSALKKPGIRSSSFLGQARNTLGWLAKKCADTSASELIKFAIKLIIGWLT